MTNMKKFLMLLTVAAIALMCFTGCSVNITSIGLPADMQLEKGETAQLEISYGADKENAKADAIAKAAEGLALVWESDNEDVPFPVSWTVKMKKKQKETQDILSYHTQAAGCSDKARAKASGGRQPIEECGRTGL